jgi:hypothetical protein
MVLRSFEFGEYGGWGRKTVFSFWDIFPNLAVLAADGKSRERMPRQFGTPLAVSEHQDNVY